VPQSIIWADTKAYTPLALRARQFRQPTYQPTWGKVKCGKSTAQAITLPDHSAVYDVKCGRPQGGLVICGCLQIGGGVKNKSFCVDVLYGRPLISYSWTEST